MNWSNRLFEVVTSTAAYYKGCRIDRLGHKYYWGQRQYPTINAARKAIDNAYQHLNLSLKK